MAKTPEQFIADLEATKQLLVTELPNIALKLTGNVKAISQKNIQEKGFGQQYSQSELPAIWFKGKELNAGGKRVLEDHGVNFGNNKKKRKKKGEGIPIDTTLSWAEFRQANGRQVNFIDLTFSGQMWRGLTPYRPEISNYIAISRLAATNEEVKKEVAYNYARYGNFILLGLGEEEFKLLQQTVIDDIFEVLNQKLL